MLCLDRLAIDMTTPSLLDIFKKAVFDQQLPTQQRQCLTHIYVEMAKLVHCAEVSRFRETAALQQTAAVKADNETLRVQQAALKADNDSLRMHKLLLETRDGHWHAYCDSLVRDGKIFQTQISDLQQQVTSLSETRDTMSQQLDSADEYTKSVIDRHQSQSARQTAELDTLKEALGNCSCCQTELGLLPLMSCPHRVCHACKPRLAICPICRSQTGVQIDV